MFKSIRAVAVSAALALSLAGCATTVTENLPPAQQPINIQQVQQLATTVCGFLPTVATVASILATFTGGGTIVSTAEGVASAICAAVVPRRGARRGAAPPRVNGVTVRGRFVR